jgi:alcohol dehydrogenase, propanol-preferring
MKAMVLREITSIAQNPSPLLLQDLPEPKIGTGEILIRVTACGVCHTELDEIEGRTPPPHLPVVLGHQVVGVVEEVVKNLQGANSGKEINKFQVGQRVGVAWIYSACGKCKYCLAGNENLCEQFQATGRDANGGYAEYMKISSEFAHPIPGSISDSDAAPLLCAGAVGYRSLRLTNIKDGQILGLTGFGASAHLVLKMVKHKYPKVKVFAFSRNAEEREFAISLGASWTGTINDTPPEFLDAIIDTTPVWSPIAQALKHLGPGGRLVINAIRKEETDKEVLQKLDYPTQLWMEKEIKSVANVTRRDVREFLDLAADAGIKPEVEEFALKDANKALLEVKQGKIHGAKVLRPL